MSAGFGANGQLLRFCEKYSCLHVLLAFWKSDNFRKAIRNSAIPTRSCSCLFVCWVASLHVPECPSIHDCMAGVQWGDTSSRQRNVFTVDGRMLTLVARSWICSVSWLTGIEIHVGRMLRGAKGNIFVSPESLSSPCGATFIPLCERT